jgi:pyruvate/2-oxoacid:ferredoxin oxidoreductase alpha subunit/NAD-dependent dihydropyrimidine dehydrogenase PreA subunit
VRERPRPVLIPEYCKGCGRCVASCNKACLADGTAIHPGTGLVPGALDVEACSACGLCFDACPEPYALMPEGVAVPDRLSEILLPDDVPPERVPLGASPSVVLKGTYASALGAVLAGCRHFFGYPITPSTEGAELMAKVLPPLGGAFVQAVSEVAAINMMYGCGAAGLPSMTFTSSPGFSLMLEGLSYMIGAEVPGVVVDVMRGGPGLGNIGPEQSDIKLACRGLGHGNTHAVVLAPATPQEMLDLTFEAFEIAFRYRNPVIVLCDGYLGQMTGRVQLPADLVRPGLPAWAVSGDRAHRRNLVSSIQLAEADLERHNVRLSTKYEAMECEARADLFQADDAEVLLVAANTPARMAKGAVEALRRQGIKAGLFRPVTLWPFPVWRLAPFLPRVERLVIVEASPGQLEDELRLALSHAGIATPPISRVQRYGGILPQVDDVTDAVRDLCAARVPA